MGGSCCINFTCFVSDLQGGNKLNISGLEINYILAVCIFVVFLYLIMSLIVPIFKKKPKNGEYYLNKTNSLDITNEEFFKVLNFMLLYGIITFEQYQELELKGLSYTR